MTARKPRASFVSMQGEEWAPALGLAYEVSNFGRVRSSALSLRGEKLRKLRTKKNGYVEVNLFDRVVSGYRSFLVHRLVLFAFVGAPPRGDMQAAHINGDRADNRLDNLRWATALANAADKKRHGTELLGERTNSAKLTVEQVKQIRQQRRARLGRVWGATDLARKFGVSNDAIRRVANGTWWKHVG